MDEQQFRQEVPHCPRVPNGRLGPPNDKTIPVSKYSVEC